MMRGLPVSSIPQCKYNHHEGACLQSFQAIGPLQPTFIEAQQASNMIYNVRLLNSRTKTRSLFEDIITSSNMVFKDFESDIAVGNRNLGNSTWVTVKRYIIVR